MMAKRELAVKKVRVAANAAMAAALARGANKDEAAVAAGRAAGAALLADPDLHKFDPELVGQTYTYEKIQTRGQR